MSLNCSKSFVEIVTYVFEMASLKFEFSRPYVICSLRVQLKNLKNNAQHNYGHWLLGCEW